MNTQEALNWMAEIFEEPAGRLTATTPRPDIPGWDSLGTLSLLAALDERFDIHLSEQDIEGLNGIKDIVDLLRRHDAVSD
jgi:acyl carrier protein